MGEKNVALAYRVLDYIEAHPEQHDQRDFLLPSDDLTELLESAGRWEVTAEMVGEYCGTVACFAGWTCLLSGKKLGRGFYWVWVVLGDEAVRVTEADTAAAHMLGIGEDDADRLFDGAGTLSCVRDAVADIFGPRPGVTA